MDGELKNLKCNISQLSAITGLHRQTVVSRLDAGVAPVDYRGMVKCTV